MKISISHVLLFLGASFCMTYGSILPAQISNSSYYIDALNGNYNNVGSQSDPWQTLDNISGNYVRFCRKFKNDSQKLEFCSFIHQVKQQFPLI